MIHSTTENPPPTTTKNKFLIVFEIDFDQMGHGMLAVCSTTVVQCDYGGCVSCRSSTFVVQSE